MTSLVPFKHNDRMNYFDVDPQSFFLDWNPDEKSMPFPYDPKLEAMKEEFRIMQLEYQRQNQKIQDLKKENDQLKQNSLVQKVTDNISNYSNFFNSPGQVVSNFPNNFPPINDLEHQEKKQKPNPIICWKQLEDIAGGNTNQNIEKLTSEYGIQFIHKLGKEKPPKNEAKKIKFLDTILWADKIPIQIFILSVKIEDQNQYQDPPINVIIDQWNQTMGVSQDNWKYIYIKLAPFLNIEKSIGDKNLGYQQVISSKRLKESNDNDLIQDREKIMSGIGRTQDIKFLPLVLISTVLCDYKKILKTLEKRDWKFEKDGLILYSVPRIFISNENKMVPCLTIPKNQNETKCTLSMYHVTDNTYIKPYFSTEIKSENNETFCFNQNLPVDLKQFSGNKYNLLIKFWQEKVHTSTLEIKEVLISNSEFEVTNQLLYQIQLQQIDPDQALANQNSRFAIFGNNFCYPFALYFTTTEEIVCCVSLPDSVQNSKVEFSYNAISGTYNVYFVYCMNGILQPSNPLTLDLFERGPHPNMIKNSTGFDDSFDQNPSGSFNQSPSDGTYGSPNDRTQSNSNSPSNSNNNTNSSNSNTSNSNFGFNNTFRRQNSNNQNNGDDEDDQENEKNQLYHLTLNSSKQFKRNKLHCAVGFAATSILNEILTNEKEKAKIWINEKDKFGFTPFWLSVFSNHTKITEKLLDFHENNNCIDFSIQNNDGHNIFHLLTYRNQITILKRIQNYDIKNLDKIFNQKIEGKNVLQIANDIEVKRVLDFMYNNSKQKKEEKKLNKDNNSLKQLENQKSETLEIVDKLMKVNQSLKQNLIDTETKLKESSKTVQDLTKENYTLNQENETLKQENEMLKQKLINTETKLNESIEMSLEQINILNQKNIEVTLKNEQFKQENENLSKQNENIKQNFIDTETKLKESSKTVEKLTKENEDLKNQNLSDIQNQLKESLETIEQVNTEHTTYKQKYENINQNLIDTETKLKESSNVIEKLTKENNALNTEKEEFKKQYQNTEQNQDLKQQNQQFLETNINMDLETKVELPNQQFFETSVETNLEIKSQNPNVLEIAEELANQAIFKTNSEDFTQLKEGRTNIQPNLDPILVNQAIFDPSQDPTLKIENDINLTRNEQRNQFKNIEKMLESPILPNAIVDTESKIKKSTIFNFSIMGQNYLDDLSTKLSGKNKQFQEEQSALQKKQKEEQEAQKLTDGETRKRLEDQHTTQMKELTDSNNQSLARLQNFQKEYKALNKQLEDMQQLLEKPIKDRQEKIDFVNNLNLKFTQTTKTLTIGNKGLGKSTFLYLIGEGEKPKRSFADGTTSLVYSEKFIDTIGISWSIENILKLLVILLYKEFPQDIIVFSNDRYAHPLAHLCFCGIVNPMFVMMEPRAIWKQISKAEERSTSNSNLNLDQIKELSDEDIIEMCYLKTENIATPLTHQDNIDDITKRRFSSNIKPFSSVQKLIGSKFFVPMEESNSIKESMGRFIYLFEKHYEKDELRFMNSCTLQEFN